MELILPHCLDMNIWQLALEQRMGISIRSTRPIKVTHLHRTLLLPIVKVLGALKNFGLERLVERKFKLLGMACHV